MSFQSFLKDLDKVDWRKLLSDDDATKLDKIWSQFLNRSARFGEAGRMAMDDKLREIRLMLENA